MILLARWKIGNATFFGLFAVSLVAFSATGVRADLTPKQARKLITRMAGFELTNGSVRVKAISVTSAAAADVSAEIRTVFKFEKDKQGFWRISEIRTGPGHWEAIDLIASGLHSKIARQKCTAPDPPFKGAAVLDPSVKRARCLLGSLLGVDVPSDAVRIQQISPLPIPLAPEPSAVVVAWIKVDARVVSDKSGWHVADLRTGNREWVSLEPLLGAVNELKGKQARAEMDSIAKALEQFRKDRGFYVVSDQQAVVIDHLNPRYLSRIIRVDPWYQPYKYQGEQQRFTLRSAGPDGKEDTADDIQLVGPLR